MSNMKELIATLRAELYSKPAPGEVLNNIAEEKSKEILTRYSCNEDAFWIGFYCADMMIFEAKSKGNLNLHIPLAVEYFLQLKDKYSISEELSTIVLDIIETHHGGEQRTIESKIFKNADCFKFLNPKGVFHIFGSFYKNSEESFKEAIEYTLYKVDEKYHLVDLDMQLIEEAKSLYEDWQRLFKRMEYSVQLPALYRK